jgi:hypothetical protein
LSVAGAIPADNSEPEYTLIPEPVGCMELGLLASDANNSPTGGTFCPNVGAVSNNDAAQPSRAVFFWIEDR